MGWSCRSEAGDAMGVWEKHCIAQTGSSNTYEADGIRYFFEASRVEHDCGAITGSAYRMLEGGKCCRKCGTFRIEGDGTVKRAPTGMSRAMLEMGGKLSDGGAS